MPLLRRGVAVDGIELSPAMIERLRGKPDGAELRVNQGDMATTRLPGRYAVVYLVYNTIFNLLTQDQQVECFQNAARHLDQGGVFVVEAGVPSAWTAEHDYARPEYVGSDRVGLDVCHYDPVTQLLDENHVELSSRGIRFSPIVCRLIWPSEMDLMARLAGLRLVNRWGGWRDEPFTAASERHVSVYASA